MHYAHSHVIESGVPSDSEECKARTLLAASRTAFWDGLKTLEGWSSNGLESLTHHLLMLGPRNKRRGIAHGSYSALTSILFLSVLLPVFALLVHYAHVNIPLVSGYSFETLLVAFLLLLAGNMIRGF